MNDRIFKEGSETEDIQRFAELGRLSASLLHEISNPLSVALLHLDQIGDQKSVGVKHVRRNLVRLTRYVNAARGQITRDGQKKSFYVSSQLSDIKRLALPVARSAFVTLHMNKVPKVKLTGDPLQFQQILLNLIINAIEAYPKANCLTLKRVVTVDFEIKKDYLLMQVRDYGSGIRPAQLKQIFEPFYTTKTVDRQGLGIGLVIVKTYVRDGFDGQIKVTSSTRRGTCFSVKIPLV